MKAINTKKETLNEESIKDEFETYYESNELKKKYDKITKELKPIILKMIENGKSKSGVYEAKKIIKEKKSLNEESAINIIKDFLKESRDKANSNTCALDTYSELKKLDLIKTKEYIDMDALERAIEKELIDPLILADAQDIQYIVELRVNKIKEK
jgi:hypothetical protein